MGDELLDEIYALAEPLVGFRVLHLNTTAKGGGVAGLLAMLLPPLRELGIEHDWRVVPLNPSSCVLMAKLTDMLQGGEPGEVSAEEDVAFLADLERAGFGLTKERADLFYVHDIQLAPLAKLNPELRPAVWFCHLDTARPNSRAERYMRTFLDPYELCVFNTPASVFKGMPAGRARVINLGIDPFVPKNAPLRREEGLGIMKRCGVDAERPVITQVSRFGRWKNPWQAVDAYRLVKRERPDVQLALVGAMEAADDVKALEILSELREHAAGGPDIHLLHDPFLIREAEVNAFQRYSTVVLQRSSREGFGFTATEAMWKEQPVIGTSATGLSYQIVHGETGFVADETEACAAYALTLMEDRDLSRKLGEQAREHVRKRFLLPVAVRDYLRAVIGSNLPGKDSCSVTSHAEPELRSERTREGRDLGAERRDSGAGRPAIALQQDRLEGREGQRPAPLDGQEASQQATGHDERRPQPLAGHLPETPGPART